MNIKGTQTEQNLLKAFAGESQARMRYDYFAKQARKEGLEQIAAIELLILKMSNLNKLLTIFLRYQIFVTIQRQK